MPHQEDAVKNLGNGKILWGGVGSGKSMTVLAYYMEKEAPKDIYVITTAKKRDSLDWASEAARFGISSEAEYSRAGRLTVDSWNNISKYTDPSFEGSFFIFDEQRVVGTGAWVRSFIKIARRNNWILLSATPGDTWLDYAPVFIANGFYENITQFKREHVLYEPFSRYPKVRGYLGETKLEILRNDILVEMPFDRHTKRVLNYLDMGVDEAVYKKALKERWNVFEGRPCKDMGEVVRVLRRIVNSDPSRLEMVRKLMDIHPRLIVFYNFNYELEILRQLEDEVFVAELNGHNKDDLPTGKRWVYLVQYVAGAEAWNCTSTDAMVLYSLTYSYKNFMQAQGRIDRLDTKFETLYYYIFGVTFGVDFSIRNSLSQKRSFNERKYILELEKFGSEIS
jgi:hypothetical protein